MQDKTLLKIAMIGGVIGLITLFLLSSTLELDEPNLSNIDDSYIDTQIKVYGTVKSIRHSEKATFLEISKVETITAVVFDYVELREGSKVEIIGKVSEYKGDKEIIAESIKIR